MHVPARRTDSGIRARWYDFAGRIPQLEVLPADEGGTQAVLEEVWRLPRGEADFVTVIVPEQFNRPSLLRAAARTSLPAEAAPARPSRASSSPTCPPCRGGAGEGRRRSASSCRVLLANVHAGVAARGQLRASRSGSTDTRAVSFAFRRRGGASGSGRDWGRPASPMPLDLSDAPYRDVGTPLLAYLRELTAEPGHGRQPRDAGDRRPRPAPPPAQPARALHQAAPALRAARDPLERPVPALPLDPPEAHYDAGFVPRRRQANNLERVLGAPALFATAYGNVGSSIYYALGLTAGIALGLTPLVFIVSGLIFAATAATYAEGTVRYPEAGGSSSFARHAFNELVSFGAAWAQMLNYVITVAISVIFVPHYLSIFWEPLRTNPWDIVVGIVLTWLLVGINIVGVKEAASLNVAARGRRLRDAAAARRARLLPDLQPAHR